MKPSIGVCTSPDRALIAARAGADHIEPSFSSITAMDQTAFARALALLRESGLPCAAMNGMLPPTLPVYGSEQQLAATMEHMRRGLERAEAMGCHTLVFGSGGARKLPDDADRTEYRQRFLDFCERICALAAPHDVRIAIEPLRPAETNWIHTVADACALVTSLPHCRNLGVNPDLYHMLQSNEPLTALLHHAPHVWHLHVCAPDRAFPRPDEPADDHRIYRDFFRTLRQADYRGSVSIEGTCTDFAAELTAALPVLRAAREEIADTP